MEIYILGVILQYMVSAVSYRVYRVKGISTTRVGLYPWVCLIPRHPQEVDVARADRPMEFRVDTELGYRGRAVLWWVERAIGCGPTPYKSRQGSIKVVVQDLEIGRCSYLVRLQSQVRRLESYFHCLQRKRGYNRQLHT